MIAKITIETEAKSVFQLVNFVDDELVSVVQKLLQNSGRLVISGIGKSANIAQKVGGHFQFYRTTGLIYACCLFMVI